jgi:lipoprotein-releasing system permease protein
MGISLGVVVLIVVMSVMNGFQTELRERLLGLASHLVIYTHSPQAHRLEPVSEYLKTDPNVLSVTWYVEADILVSQDQSVIPAQLRGFDPEERELVEGILPFLQGVENVPSLRFWDQGVILGSELAEALGVGPGETVSLLVPEIQSDGIGMMPRIQTYRIIATLRANVPQYDGTLAMLSRSNTQTFLADIDPATGVRVTLNEYTDAFSLARVLKTRFPDMTVLTWADMHKSFFAAIKIEKMVMFVILLLIIAVAAFNIVSTLAVTVSEKQSDIAILMTLGASPRMIRWIFLIQGSVVGVIGVVIGLLAGIPMALFFPQLIGGLEWLLGFKVFSPDVFYISEIPSILLWKDVAGVTLFTLVTALLATLYPSWRASSIAPATALRYE